MKNYKILVLLLTALHLFTFSVWAQVKVSGKVTDGNNQPLQGVHIEVQERGINALSDEQGRFSLQAGKGDVLVLSRQGLVTFYYDVSDEKTALIIQLERSLPEAGQDDVVNIPFDVRTSREINGAISTIKASDLPRLPVSSLSNLLSGRLPGLYVAQTGTQPGNDGASLLVRNQATFTGSNNSLILVDGVQRDFPDMDQNEIESITVLKDAASLAWFGSRGANGIVLITTKRGSAEKTRFTYDVQAGFQLPTVLSKPLDSYTFASLYNQALQNDGFAPLYSPAALAEYQSGNDRFKYPSVNFMDEFFGKSAFLHRHVLTASGGSKAIRYFTSLSFYDQNGLYRNASTSLFNTNAGFNRYNLRNNLDIQVTPQLKVQLDIGVRVEDRREPGGTNATFLNTLFGTPPNAFPLLNEDGSYGGNTLFRVNPLAQLQSEGYRSEVTRVLLGTLNASQKLDFVLPGLSATVFYTFDIQGRYTSGRSQAYEVYEQAANGTLIRYGTQTPIAYLASAFSDNIRVNELWGGLDYNKIFKNHGFKANFRYQQGVSAAATRFDDKIQGFSGRASYSFKNRYYADLVAGYTGTDNFMPGKQFGFFPAAAIGWVISDENFLKNVKFINYLKLRGSAGKAGNNETGEDNKFPYAYLTTPSNGSYAFGTGFSTQAGASERTLPNPEITWEKAQKLDVGIDAKLLGSRLGLSATYFSENRKDILTNPIYPSILGLTSFRVNKGETTLKGFEGMINYTQQVGDLILTIEGNFTYAQNKIIHINESAGLIDYQQQAGHNIGGVTGMGKLMLQADGIFKSQAEIDNSPVQRFAGKLVPGDIKYKDINNDNVIDNFDRVMTDYNNVPNIYYGFNMKGNFKAVDFSILFQGIEGRTIQNRTLVLAGTNNTGYINQFSPGAWSASNPSGRYPRLGISDRGNNTADSDFWLQSGDYLRLKSVEIGYNLSGQFMQKLRIKGIRVYVNGFNLVDFSKGDVDPELPFAGFNAYPYLRTVSAGLNVKF